MSYTQYVKLIAANPKMSIEDAARRLGVGDLQARAFDGRLRYELRRRKKEHATRSR